MPPRDVPTEPGTYLRKAESWDDEAWASVPNRLLRDQTVSWEAKGAFGWIASHREVYKLSAEDLADAGPKGRHNAREMLRELEFHGYLTREPLRNPATGVYDVHLWTLHPRPVPADQRTWRPSKAAHRPHPGAQNRRSIPESNSLDSGERADGHNCRSTPESNPPDVGPPTSGGLDSPYKEEKTNQKNKPTLPPAPSTSLAAVAGAGGSEGGAMPGPNIQLALTEAASDPARDLVRTLRLPDGSRRPNRAELAELHRLTDQALAAGWPPAALRAQVLGGLDQGRVSDPVRVLLARLDPQRLLPADPQATPEQIAAAHRWLRGSPTAKPAPDNAPVSDHTREQALAAIRDQLSHRRRPRAAPSPGQPGSEAS